MSNRISGRSFKCVMGALAGIFASVLSTVSGTAAPATDNAGEVTSLSEMLSAGKTSLNFRYRYEFVDQDGFSKDANASTVRSRLAFQSAALNGFSFFIEAEDVREIILDDFNSGAGTSSSRRNKYPVVADPEGSEFNQAYIDYNSEGWRVRLGRQRINLDNQRFVGGVGWRQNEQTYDGLSVNYSNEMLTAFIAYIDNVNRIFGDDVPAGDSPQDGTFLVNVAGDIDRIGKLTGYYYTIDAQNDAFAATSTDTYGLRLSGKQKLDTTSVRYAAEYASQSDKGNNPVSYDADYYNLDAGVIYENFDVGIGWEVLTGNADTSGKAFRTPFATLHAFNGWADRFLSTPGAGLDDKYLKVKTTLSETLVQLRYHRFEAEDGGTDFGDEIDFRVGRKLNKYVRGDLFLANFSGDNGFPDTTKVWLMFSIVL